MLVHGACSSDSRGRSFEQDSRAADIFIPFVLLFYANVYQFMSFVFSHFYYAMSIMIHFIDLLSCDGSVSLARSAGDGCILIVWPNVTGCFTPPRFSLFRYPLCVRYVCITPLSSFRPVWLLSGIYPSSDCLRVCKVHVNLDSLRPASVGGGPGVLLRAI